METRLGQALRQTLHDEQTSPLAGIVVFTDGGQNAGVAPDAAIQAARENKIPLFLVGVGSDRQPARACGSATWRRRRGPSPATAIR